MFRGAVVGTDRRGDPSLRVSRIPRPRPRLREHEDVAGALERGRGPKRRDAAPDNQEIGLQMFVIVSPVLLDVGSRSGRYGIHIEPGVAARVRGLLDGARLPGRRFLVSNPTVWRLHEQAFTGLTTEEPVLIPDGERHKNLQTVGRLYDPLIRA